jgi:hypothetical protein
MKEINTLENRNLTNMTDDDLWLAYSYTQYLHIRCQDPFRRLTYQKDIRLMRQEVIRRRFIDV